MSLLKFPKRTFQIYIQTILTLVLTFPFIILVLIPTFIFRCLISIWSNFFIKSNGNILSPLNTVFALDDFRGQPASTIVLTLCLSGQPKLSQVISKFERILESGDYPELQQSLSMWMGFFFWKWDPEFSLKNHIDFIDKPQSSEEIQKLGKFLLKKPYEKDRPVWSVTFVPLKNDSDSTDTNKSFCIFRFHHSLVDGQSLYKLVTQFVNKDSFTQPKANFPSKNLLAKIIFGFKFVFYGPFELISTILGSQDENEWKSLTAKCPQAGSASDRNQNTIKYRGIKLNDLKTIATSQNVTITAVIISLLTSAIRQMMKKYNKSQSVPDLVTVLCAWPMRNPPDRKLTNYTTVSPLKVPVGQPDPFQRLDLIQIQLTNLKHSTLPYGFFALSYLIGNLFPWLIKRINLGQLGTVVFSNFAACKDSNLEIFDDGIIINDLHVDVGLPAGFPMGFVSVGFNGILSISNGSDKNLFPKEEMAQEFMDFVVKEFDVLKGSCDV